MYKKILYRNRRWNNYAFNHNVKIGIECCISEHFLIFSFSYLMFLCIILNQDKVWKSIRILQNIIIKRNTVRNWVKFWRFCWTTLSSYYIFITIKIFYESLKRNMSFVNTSTIFFTIRYNFQNFLCSHEFMHLYSIKLTFKVELRLYLGGSYISMSVFKRQLWHD